MINTTLSCTPPIVQLAGTAALKRDKKERDEVMLKFREKVVLLTEGLNRIDGFRALDPTATFYVFPNVARVCNKLGVTSHGLALYMLQGADDKFGIACLGGECFGQAGAGFLRFSCAEPNDRLQQALDFIPKAIARTDRLAAWLDKNPQHRLAKPVRRRIARESSTRRTLSYVKPVMPFTGLPVLGADTVRKFRRFLLLTVSP